MAPGKYFRRSLANGSSLWIPLGIKNLSQICRKLGYGLACDTSLLDIWRTGTLPDVDSGDEERAVSGQLMKYESD